MYEYIYFPSHYQDPIKTLLLDANVTARLDTITRRGSDFKDEAVRARLTGLLPRLDKNVVVMAGLGAGEAVMRRGNTEWEFSNYHRRCRNAERLLTDEIRTLRSWLEGKETSLAPFKAEDDETLLTDTTEVFKVVYENLLLPSYALVLKIYQLYLEGQSPLASLRILDDFAGEIYGRGSREVLLGTMLLTGNSEGRDLALSIMKLHTDNGFSSTLDKLWNTSFDLTYSRIAVQGSLPELRDAFPKPTVFVTEDKHLGKFLALIHHVGATSHVRGGGTTADLVTLDQIIPPALWDEVAAILKGSTKDMLQDTTRIELVSPIRRHRSMEYIKQSEEWFAKRYQA